MSQLEQQMRHRDKEMVPKFLVQAMFGLMIATTALVAYAQWADLPNRGVLIEAPVAQSLDVVIKGDRAGIYEVFDTSGNWLAISSEDKAGFIGVIGRVIERERLVFGVDADAPVTIMRRENGNVAIKDASTGMSVELIGYGKDNVAAFAKLLD